MQATIKLTITVDVDDIESTLDRLDHDDIEIECDDVVTVYGNDLQEQIDFLVLCDKIGQCYSEFCEYHSQYFSESDYYDAYIGTYNNIQEYAEEYYHSYLTSLPSILSDNIDWTAVADDMQSDLVVIQLNREIAIFSA